MKAGDGYVVAYSVMFRATFEDAEAFIQQILQSNDPGDFPMILVGNHCEGKDIYREVTQAEGEALAKTCGCPFHEVHVDIT
jgi:GTPase SAR1 family protein